jgi:hypothetical protein
MGSEQNRNPMIAQVCWRLVDIVSGLLTVSEREAVLGDLSESGETCGNALREVVGLVFRRQAAVWMNWRPWLILGTLIFPLSFLLSVKSQATAGESAVYTWMYANNWDWHIVQNSGFWYVFTESATLVLMSCITLVGWSWSGGFVLGYLSPEFFRVNRVVFLLMLAFAQLVDAPGFIIKVWYLHHATAPSVPNAPIFAIGVYGAILSVFILCGLVVLPAISGMRQGEQATRLPLLFRIPLMTAAFLTISLMMLGEPEFTFFLNASGREWIWRSRQTINLLQSVAYWPALYLVAIAIKQPGSAI